MSLRRRSGAFLTPKSRSFQKNSVENVPLWWNIINGLFLGSNVKGGIGTFFSHPNWQVFYRLHNRYTDVSENRVYPQIIHFNRVFHYKPSILGYPYFWKHPYVAFVWGLYNPSGPSTRTRIIYWHNPSTLIIAWFFLAKQVPHKTTKILRKRHVLWMRRVMTFKTSTRQHPHSLKPRALQKATTITR